LVLNQRFLSVPLGFKPLFPLLQFSHTVIDAVSLFENVLDT
jgi:hypothetical protein